MSIQSEINTGYNGEVDEEKLNKYLKEIIEEGWEEISKEEIKNLPKSIGIKYITKKVINDTNKTDTNKKSKPNCFRSGGYILEHGEDNYLIFRSHGQSVFSLQYKDIERLWAKHPNRNRKKKKEEEVNYETKNVPFFTKPGEETKFTAEINGIIVKYCRNNFDLNRFMSTTKYKRALVEGFEFF